MLILIFEGCWPHLSWRSSWRRESRRVEVMEGLGIVGALPNTFELFLCFHFAGKWSHFWIFPRFSITRIIMNYQFDSGWSGCPWWSSSTGTGMWMKHFPRWQCWRFQAWRCRWWSSSGNWSWGWVAFGTATAFRTWVVQLQVRGAFFGLSIVSTIGFEWYSWKEDDQLCIVCVMLRIHVYFMSLYLETKIQYKYRCSIGFLKNTSAKKDITNRTENCSVLVLYPVWIQKCRCLSECID